MTTEKFNALTAKITRLANRGARKSQAAAHAAGIANPYMLNGRLVYQLPDGTITEKYEYPKPKAKK